MIPIVISKYLPVFVFMIYDIDSDYTNALRHYQCSI